MTSDGPIERTMETRLRRLPVIAALTLLPALAGCERVVYVDRVVGSEVAPTPTPSAEPAARCSSVPRDRGDCYRTAEDVHLSAVEGAHDAAAAEPGLLYKGLIQGGAAYIEFVVGHLRDSGLCAGVYENEEVAVWAPGAEFSENWDVILEPGDGRILPRRGAGAHDWSCRPPTTENGS